jgi:glycosyltransferase involved in cell wall biosynthesis
MRVALAHKLFRVTGGAEVFFRETERVVRENGNETLMIATGTPEDVAGHDNVLLLDAPKYDSPGLLDKVTSLPPAIYDLGKKRRIKAALADFRPDIVHIFAMNVHISPAVVLAADELDIPIVGTFNDYKHICPNYKLFHHGKICFDCRGQRFWQAVRNRCCKDSRALSIASMAEAYVHDAMDVYGRFDHFTFSSRFLADTTRAFWSDREISWSRLLNPFDSVKYVPSPDYDAYGLYFGRLIDEKGVDRLVSAAAAIDGFQIRIVGDGPDLEKLRAQAAGLGLTNVSFLGAKWGAELDDILARARFVVVPSIWHENFPYVINQSFALARPVIGADRGGIPELVSHDERGLVFDPDDIASLSTAIRRLAGDVPLARRLGMAAKHWSDATFRDQTAYVDVLHAYEEAMRANRSHRR